MSKGEETRDRIVRYAARVASRDGLEGLSIGALASELEMSKSGLFAHFGSKQELQIEILRAAALEFERKVVHPALKQPRGAPRLRTLFDLWLKWVNAPETPGGCVFIAAAFELDDHPGPVRDFLVEQQRALFDVIARSARVAVDSGLFRKDLDCEQLALEVHALAIGFHHARRLLRLRNAEALARRSFDQLITRALPAD
jgi:AcrR family transcriptional regulator